MKNILTTGNYMMVLRLAACAYSVALGLLAVLDMFNRQTLPLDSWRLVVAIEVVVMVCGLLMSVMRLARHADRANHTTQVILADQQSTGEKAPIINNVKSKSDQKMCADKTFTGSVSRRVMDVLFFSSHSMFALWALMQIVFLYNYTTDSPGYQAALDQGLPTADPFYYVPLQKVLFDYTLELQAFVSVGSFLARQAICHSHRVHEA